MEKTCGKYLPTPSIMVPTKVGRPPKGIPYEGIAYEGIPYEGIPYEGILIMRGYPMRV